MSDSNASALKNGVLTASSSNLDKLPSVIEEFKVNYGSFKQTQKKTQIQLDQHTIFVGSKSSPNQDGLFTIETDYIDKKFNGIDLDEEAIRKAYMVDNSDVREYLSDQIKTMEKGPDVEKTNQMVNMVFHFSD